MGASPESKARLLRHLAAHPGLPNLLEGFTELSEPEARGLLSDVANAISPRSSAPGPTRTAAPPSSQATAPSPRAVASGVRRVIVYSDGASRGNPGLAGAGAVLMTPEGEVVDRLGKFLGRQTNNHAEYAGVILGLERAKELGVEEVEVRADSQLMIRQLGGQYRLKAEPLRPLFNEAVALLKGFRRVKLVHVPREMNTEADEMSNRAIDERM
jgi:ribonuclease HI